MNKAEVEKISMSAMSVEAISACGLKTGSEWWQMQEPLNHGLNIWNQKIHWIFGIYPEGGGSQEKTGLHEAVTIGRCKIYGEETVLGICDARFLMSSMGHVVGEKIALGVERATDLKLPVILFCFAPVGRECRKVLFP